VTRFKEILLVFIVLVYCAALAMVINNFQDREMTRNLLMLALPTLICGLAFFYAYRLSIKELLFVAIPIVVIAVFLEIGFWIYLSIFPDRAPSLLWGHGEELGEYFVYRPHHYTLYTLKEGYRNNLGTIHNKQGFRNTEDLPLEKPPCEFRIFFIGGSSTYTVGIKDNKKIFTATLETALNREASHRGLKTKFRVINAGMGAATSAENLSRLIFLILPYEPDLVVLQHGLNDVLARLRGTITSDYSNYRRMWCRDQSPYDFFLKRWAYDYLIENSRLLTFLAVRLKMLEPNTIRGMVNNNDYEEDLKNLDKNGAHFFKRNTELMVGVAGYAGSDVILASCPYNERAGEARILAMPEHNRILQEVALKTGTPFFDLYSLFNKSPQYLPDGLHVRQKGSDLKQELYFSFLEDSYGLFKKAAQRVGERCNHSE
jgi:lysophospholipase L1-like esterase